MIRNFTEKKLNEVKYPGDHALTAGQSSLSHIAAEVRIKLIFRMLCPEYATGGRASGAPDVIIAGAWSPCERPNQIEWISIKNQNECQYISFPFRC